MAASNCIRQTTRRFNTASTLSSEIVNPHNQTITLRDGRTLGFAQYGDLDGKPLVYLHGFPSSRLEFRDVDQLAKKLNIHVIAPDRPGFGLSTLRPPGHRYGDFPARRIIDYPEDLLALTDQLGVKRFSVLGGSAGGPYALACAHLLPSARVANVGLMASSGPWTVTAPPGGNDMSKELRRTVMWKSWILYLGSTYAPRASIAITDLVYGWTCRMLDTKWATNWIDKWLEGVLKNHAKAEGNTDTELSEEVRASMPTIRKGMIEVFKEGFAQGGEGAIRDVYRLTQPLGIPYPEIKFPVKVWHGAKDVNSPVGPIRYMADQLPNARYVEYPDFDHFMVGNKMEEILVEMMEERPTVADGQ